MASLGERVENGAPPQRVLDLFLDWASERGLELYPAQEEALLEMAAGKHVILNTPTGSGKSLVALAMHFMALCRGERSFYTAPIKALVSEKFFALCDELGAERVGMITGDAGINPDAPVICCTAEILARDALRRGRHTPADWVCMDEFHYYGDPERGVSWQIPLIELCDSGFLLMSATLGDVRGIAERLERESGRAVAVVRSAERPVPLDFEYRDSQLLVTIRDLVEQGRAPIYLVHFTQREATESAQALTSATFSTREEKQQIGEMLGGFRFDTPFGKEMRRITRSGIGLHHAGLLPKYRLLVEQLSQKGLLKIICGTDTLGVGVNIPIRTVLFTRLYKFDGEAGRLLTARELHQIAGRAGRRGFDSAGSVVCQAPEHVIENKSIDAKGGGKKKKRPAPKGFVHYDESTFNRLVASEPEPLHSQFEVTHTALTAVLEREPTHGRRHGGYRRIIELIARSHESDRAKKHHRRHAATLFRALAGAGIVQLVRPEWDRLRPYARLDDSLQRDFSMHHTLSLWLVHALSLLDRDSESYALQVVSLVEAILESPSLILARQVDKLKGDLISQLKAEGVPYEERLEKLEELTHPQPDAEMIYGVFDAFRETRPWVRQDNVRPKSIARDMVERFASFNDYVLTYGLERSEGVLLRYLSEAYKTLVQSVPDSFKDERVLDLSAYLRTELGHVDTSLLREWESLLAGVGAEPAERQRQPAPFDLAREPKLFASRVRAEAHRLVKALAQRSWEEAALSVRPSAAEPWTAERFEQAMAPYFAAHGELLFDHRARLSDLTQIRAEAPRRWRVLHTLVDPAGERDWFIEAMVDLTEPGGADGSLLAIERVGS